MDTKSMKQWWKDNWYYAIFLIIAGAVLSWVVPKGIAKWTANS